MLYLNSTYCRIVTIKLILLIATLTATALTFPSFVLAEKQTTLVFGLLPSESAVTKIKRYAPLRDYLSEKLKRKVILETARDFPEFIRRTKERKYDFLETAPHFVPAAIDSGKYVVLTTIIQPLSAQIVVKKGSKYDSIESLANSIIATPSPKAIITKIGRNTIDSKGLTGSKAPDYRSYKTHNAAYEAVLGGQADAAIISINIYNKALRKKEPLIAIGESHPIPNMSILAAIDLPEALRTLLKKELIDMKNHKEGMLVHKKTSYPGYRSATAGEFDVLRKYLK